MRLPRKKKKSLTKRAVEVLGHGDNLENLIKGIKESEETGKPVDVKLTWHATEETVVQLNQMLINEITATKQ